jgi:hypothetical protein
MLPLASRSRLRAGRANFPETLISTARKPLRRRDQMMVLPRVCRRQCASAVRAVRGRTPEFADLYRAYGDVRADGSATADSSKRKTVDASGFKSNRQQSHHKRKRGEPEGARWR